MMVACDNALQVVQNQANQKIYSKIQKYTVESFGLSWIGHKAMPYYNFNMLRHSNVLHYSLSIFVEFSNVW